MNDNEAIIERLLEVIEGAANMMRGMQLDPSVPNAAKEALKHLGKPTGKCDE